MIHNNFIGNSHLWDGTSDGHYVLIKEDDYGNALGLVSTHETIEGAREAWRSLRDRHLYAIRRIDGKNHVT